MRVQRSQIGRETSATTPIATDVEPIGATPAKNVDLTARFAAAMVALGFDSPPKRFALALSGGGDSVALLYLLRNWVREQTANVERVSFHALIVDHELREGSDRDAKRAASIARNAGWHAHVLKWTGDKPKANVEDAARVARYALLGQWCRAHRTQELFVAHTRDDLAETFLLRLGRGSGVDGLSAMRGRASFPVPEIDDCEILRPLLDFERSELRDYLAERQIVWLEDPMNADPRFSRVKVRRLMPMLEEAGISRNRIADAAHHLARARSALEEDVAAFLNTHTQTTGENSILFDGEALGRVPHEIGL